MNIKISLLEKLNNKFQCCNRSFVRLGEHDLSTTDDGEVQDVKVIKSQPHEKYNKKDGTNDIAILYLEHDVNLTSELILISLLSDSTKDANE